MRFLRVVEGFLALPGHMESFCIWRSCEGNKYIDLDSPEN